MNDRIRELAEQATSIVEIVNPDTGITHHREFFDKEKFAELIVQECAEIAKHNVMNISTYADAEFVDQQIMKHFGVEE